MTNQKPRRINNRPVDLQNFYVVDDLNTIMSVINIAKTFELYHSVMIQLFFRTSSLTTVTLPLISSAAFL